MSYTGNKTMVDLTNKFKFYQDIRLWPKNSDFNYEAWLDNFDAGEERNLAQCILDFFIFFPDDIIRNPRGIENDLEKLGKDFPVKAYIRPMN